MTNTELIKGLRWCADESICCDDFSGEKCPYFDEKKDSCSVDEILHDAADAIEELISRVPKWISVKEKLPTPIHPSSPDYKAYLIVADGDMYIADYTYDKYFETCYSFHVDGEEMTGVTHWCKIPEPPKGE